MCVPNIKPVLVPSTNNHFPFVSTFQVLIYNENETRFREMQSQSVMLQLDRGDEIYLRSYSADDYALYSNLGNYITFTGYLVFAT